MNIKDSVKLDLRLGRVFNTNEATLVYLLGGGNKINDLGGENNIEMTL